jgi:hypothetical protein
MTESTESLYLRDLAGLLSTMARRAKEEVSVATETERDLALGRLMAMHDVISLMQQQAIAFGLAPEEIGLGDIVPERDLL